MSLKCGDPDADFGAFLSSPALTALSLGVFSSLTPSAVHLTLWLLLLPSNLTSALRNGSGVRRAGWAWVGAGRAPAASFLPP